MIVSDVVRKKTEKFREGYVFTYTDLNMPADKTEAVIKALNRMVKRGELKKISRGKYYRPRKTDFGELKPETYQIVKDLLEKDGKPTGYLTGFSIFNKLGLTTQVSNTIQIGINAEKKNIRRGIYRIHFVRQKNPINKKNIPLLQILDTVRYIKNIPDASIDNSCKRISDIIKRMTPDDLKLLVKLALNYPPSTRVLTGAIIESEISEEIAKPLWKSLNYITQYKYNLSEKVLQNKTKWRIR